MRLLWKTVAFSVHSDFIPIETVCNKDSTFLEINGEKKSRYFHNLIQMKLYIDTALHHQTQKQN